MQTFGTILGVLLIVGMLAYITFSVVKLVRDFLHKRDKNKDKDIHNDTIEPSEDSSTVNKEEVDKK